MYFVYWGMQKYQIIYADPPWSVGATNQNPSGRRHVSPYLAMRQCDIFDLDVVSLSHTDCCLFLWATAPLLPEAIYTLKAWGFEYKTVAFTWVKKNKKASSWFWGMGSWTRSNPEYCLLGMKGSPKRVSRKIHSVIDTPIEAHSKKPDIVRDKIVELCGDVPRIELFAREKISGWNSWGNEI